MYVTTVPFDLRVWNTHSQIIVQEYTHNLMKDAFSPVGIQPENCLYRGGFGRKEDLEKVIATGSDYDHNGTYVARIEKLGWMPWSRHGFDPLFFALRGANPGSWNKASAIVAYHKDALTSQHDYSEFVQGKPTTDAIAAVIKLTLKGKIAVAYAKKIAEQKRKQERFELDKKVRALLEK